MVFLPLQQTVAATRLPALDPSVFSLSFYYSSIPGRSTGTGSFTSLRAGCGKGDARRIRTSHRGPGDTRDLGGGGSFQLRAMGRKKLMRAWQAGAAGSPRAASRSCL